MEEKQIYEYLEKNLRLNIESIGYGRKIIRLVLEEKPISETVLYED